MQAKPPRADMAAASSEIRAAWALRLRIVFHGDKDMERMVNGGLPTVAIRASRQA